MQSNIVLLAGGNGTRLWPISNNNCPKQFIKLPLKNLSSFQQTLQRSIKICPCENIIITANYVYKDLIYKQIDELSLQKNKIKIIFEKQPNNTGLAVYFSCLYLLQQQNNNLSYIFPTDHIIEEEGDFFTDFLKSADSNKINLLGKEKQELCSNFGYMITEKTISPNYFKVKKFFEKPNNQIIKKIKLEKNNIFKNLGIYLAKTEVFFNELKKYNNNLPYIGFNENNEQFIDKMFENLSLDKMLAEHSSILNVKKVSFSWLDIGSLNSMYKYCDNLEISCTIEQNDVKKFNQENKEFELIHNNGYTKITKKVKSN